MSPSLLITSSAHLLESIEYGTRAVKRQATESLEHLSDRLSEVFCPSSNALTEELPELSVTVTVGVDVAQPIQEDVEKGISDCVTERDLPKLKELFDAASQEERLDAFCRAISYQEEAMVQFFLEKGMSIYEETELGDTPLRMAIAYDRDIALMFCRREERIRDSHALSYAIYNRDKEVIRLIMSKMEDIPAIQELIALEILKETHKQELLEDENLLASLMLGFKTVPYGLVKDLVNDLKDIASTETIYQLYSLGFVKNDPKLLAILKEEVPVYEEGARVYFHSKWTSHVLGLEGTFEVSGDIYDCEECFQELYIPQFKKYLRAYLEDSSTTLGVRLPPTIAALKREMLETLDKSHDGSRSLDQIVANIRSGKPEIFVTGWDTHAVAFVFHNGILVRCNRGDQSGDFPGLEVFSYDPVNVNKALVSNLLHILTNSEKCLPSSYFTDEVQVSLGAEKVGTFLMSRQGKENCGWASPKASFFALVMTHKSEVHSKKMSVSDRAKLLRQEMHDHRLSYRKTYKDFTRFTRLKVAKEDLLAVFDSSVDDAFAIRAVQKAKAKYVLCTTP